MKSPVKIVEFAFVAYPATDLARSRAFYEGVLGLTSATAFQDGDQFWIEYEVGHLVLEVENFEETIAHLRRNHVPFALEPAVMPPGCHAAIITDPDGNKLGLHQRKT
jgi:catechol 2,3-dioxygenase-like lactoylglutathione lyase family enzyme